MQWSNQRYDIVSASQDGQLIIWDAFNAKKRESILLTSSWVMTCSWSPTGFLVASGGLATSVRYIESTAKKIIRSQAGIRIPTGIRRATKMPVWTGERSENFHIMRATYHAVDSSTMKKY
eukprot:TRINITY_DN9010_c0_g1_i1.p2 TRINITY_DN9010_c0_g1~~TRINITY_DN9010_c0_g1_i1.p2  ORF type:complete len:120 (-),score=11.40 TRINITY_DN9010_c0_g1_i1:343-702(-)